MKTVDRVSRRAGRRREQKAAAPAEARFAGIRYSLWRRAILWMMLVVFARYYYWIVRPDPSQPLREIGLYSLLTDAFRHGQASLTLAPAPQLLALPDPYDPVQNAPYRIHDASLYKGRYYIYFGPAPVISLYLPYLLVTGEFLPDRIGTWVFATAAYGMACLLLKLLLARWWPQLPRWMFYFLCGCLGFSNIFPFLLRRPAVYETAIAAGQFFVLLALYAIARSAFDLKHPLVMAAVGGAALAGAFGSRPQLVLAAVAFGWFLVLGKSVPLRDRLQRMVAALIPFAVGMALLLFYNYARFGSPLEFGQHYQLAGSNITRLQEYFSISRLTKNLWFDLLEPPRLRSQFPFVILAPNPPFHIPKDFLQPELVAGILWMSPLLLLLAAAPLVWKKIEPARRLEWAVCTGTLVFLGVAWLSVVGMLASTMRYEVDFATVLFVAAAAVIAGFSERYRPRMQAWVYRSVVALGLFGVVVNGAIGMTGYYDNFRMEAPAEYQRLAEWFNPVSKVLAWCGVPADWKPAPEVRR